MKRQMLKISLLDKLDIQLKEIIICGQRDLQNGSQGREEGEAGKKKKKWRDDITAFIGMT